MAHCGWAHVAARPREGGSEVPVFKLEAEDGTWLTEIRLGPPNRKPGDRIPRGDDTLEVDRVRYDDERDLLVVRPVRN
jgi:hypothetical protein